MKQKVILDCDNTFGLPGMEIDDGLALLYLLGRPDIDLLGVTATFGNGTLEQACSQTRMLLDKHAHGRIQVYPGAAQAGDAQTAAAQFLAEMAAAHAGEISVAAIGPLSNLLAAWKFDPAFFRNLRQVVCMGGYLSPLRIGRRDLPELNFSADPQASFAALNADCPLTVMCAQTCLQASFGWGDLRRADFFDVETRSVIESWLSQVRSSCGVDQFILWDLLPVVFLEFPDLFDRREAAITSSVDDLRQGKLVIQEKRRGQRLINMPLRIVDVSRFASLLYDAWAAACR